MRTSGFSWSLGLSLALVACAHKPPAGFAPDPGLVARIRSLEMATGSTLCPSQTLGASYTAVLDDGSRIPFATSYDEHHPPQLHVSFLTRSSPQARALDNGNWVADPDPLLSASGFVLRIAMPQAPQLTLDTIVPPDYECLPHELRFDGAEDADGPDITVRLAQGHSPYFPQLLIAAIDVRRSPTRYVLADATRIPPRNWLAVIAAGGRGPRGRSGHAGPNGAAGGSCTNGGDGGPGRAGGDGGSGGRGGHIVIIVPSENPFLAGVVDARTPGGHGGDGGHGGAGGRGGAGGAAGQNCLAGHAGQAGASGPNGNAGEDGPRGTPPQIITVPNAQVLGGNLPPVLARLVDAGPPVKP